MWSGIDSDATAIGVLWIDVVVGGVGEERKGGRNVKRAGEEGYTNRYQTIFALLLLHAGMQSRVRAAPSAGPTSATTTTNRVHR